MADCYVAAASPDYLDIEPGCDEFVIAADGGYDRVAERCNLVIGDLDSVERDVSGCEILRFPVRKNDTDLMLALKEGVRRGFSSFILNGVSGGRPDQSYATIQALAWLKSRNLSGIALSSVMHMTMLENQSVSFENREGGFSLFSYTPEAEISIRGAEYNLDCEVITSDFPIGVSNKFTCQRTDITIHRGMVLMFWEGEPFKNSVLKG